MKKLTLVLLAGFSFATAANAQSIRFGVKAGANFSNASGDGLQGLSTSTLVGFNGGVFLGLGITDNLFIQPELVYSGQGFKGAVSGTTVTQHENYINIPVLVKYQLPIGLYFQTGPQVGFLMSAKESAGGASQDDKAQFKSIDLAWAVGAGFQVPATQLGIDVRYNIGLANIADNSGGGSGSVKNGVFQVGLTYTLFNAGK
jgi:hypothetical protein